MEFNEENFKALLEKSTSLEWAITAERANSKEYKAKINELSSKFEEIEKSKASKKEQELVKQGKLEQLLEQKNNALSEYEQRMADTQKMLDEMNWKVEEYNQYKTAQQAKAMEALAKKLESFDETKRETLMGLVKDKPVEEQGAIIDQLITLNGTPDYKVNPKSGDKAVIPDVNETYTQAKQGGDIMWMIMNAPTKAI